MDYIHAGYSYQNIRQDFPQIADEQFNAAMSYIEANRAEVEAEYQIVIKEDEEVKRYWEEQNRDRFAKIALIPPKPEQEAIREKLAEWKARIVSRTNE
jgi:hypothetical protein